MLLNSTFSELLGYASIASWLGAQFPQVIENIRNQSVEGLALPFLINWLLGDSTNLIGCILTHQLPFQTYLAIYFCLVDFSLLSQYFYYASRAKKKTRSYLSRERPVTGSVAGHRLSLDRGAGGQRYRTLSTVAANVAAVAALAAQQEEQAHWHRRSQSTEPRPSTYEDDEEVSEDALARLAESFHSEGGRSSRRKQVAWSNESYSSRGPSVGRSRQPSAVPTVLQMSNHVEDLESLARGRPLIRAADLAEDIEEWPGTNAHRRSSRSSRKGATMVFMGVWALFGVGALAGGKSPLSTGLVGRTGKILARADVPLSFTQPTPGAYAVDSFISAQVAGESAVYESVRASESTERREPEQPDMERIIGRISAWMCTTLYLTSRLPQIWKNYVRKSVEGLSMYLFIFAFLGNLFYVASILTSPNLDLPEPEASAFLRESVPYLLGSGGTLMFDVTIVTQSYLYRPKVATRDKRVSHTYNEEEAGLLNAESTGAEESPAAPRRRAGSVTRDGVSGF